jgi:hypothetical protein
MKTPPPLRTPGTPEPKPASIPPAPPQPEKPTESGWTPTPEALGFRASYESCENCEHFGESQCGLGKFQCEPQDGCIHGFEQREGGAGDIEENDEETGTSEV